MFVSFSKRLKSMSGFRLGVGLRLTRRNCWYFLFVLVLVGCFYFCWYSVLACGWMLYGLLYPRHGFLCWGADGTCLRSRMNEINEKKEDNDHDERSSE